MVDGKTLEGYHPVTKKQKHLSNMIYNSRSSLAACSNPVPPAQENYHVRIEV
jgi:hypothetical protein